MAGCFGIRDMLSFRDQSFNIYQGGGWSDLANFVKKIDGPSPALKNFQSPSDKMSNISYPPPQVKLIETHKGEVQEITTEDTGD